MNDVAIILVNYNMTERADALCKHIILNEEWPYELIVVDNGSDCVPPSEFTTVRIENNVQTTRGWLAGLKYAKSLDIDWFAYWFLITSSEFPPENVMPLTELATFLVDNPQAVGIHPALTKDSTSAWTNLKCKGRRPRQTWGFDNIASLYRADWFDGIGWFDPDLIYGWGIDLETCWKARRDNRSLWIHDGCLVKKVTDIGYTMNRMGMTADERREMASDNMHKVLGGRYGENWLEKLTQEFIEPPMTYQKKRTYYRLD